MADQRMGNLLSWSIANSAEANPDGVNASQAVENAPRGLNEDVLRSLMGGPSDADIMKESISVILHPEAELEAKLIAFDNLEQLVENIDNANNLAPLGLWPPLISQLEHTEAQIRTLAAWCVGTAVQNNEKCQQRALQEGVVPKICTLAVHDEDKAMRRKAVYALSSLVRNYQPGMDEALKSLPKEYTGPDHVNASDMDVVDAIMAKLRDQ